MKATAELNELETKSQLPDGWRRVKLDEVCEEKTSVRDPRREPDKPFRYVDITSVDNKSKRISEVKTLFGKDSPSRARQVIRSGDVIVSTTRPNLNAVALIPPELGEQICSTGFCVLRATPDLDSGYLFGFVQTADFVGSLSELVKGALYPAVTDNQVREQIISLPPLAEQKRIAGILKEQMAAVECARRSAEAQLQAAESLPAAHLRAVFNSLEAQVWPKKKLGEHITKIGSGFTPLGGQSSYQQSGVPLIRSQNIHINRFERDGLAFISDGQDADMEGSRVEKNGVLLNITGASIGRVCVAPTELCPANVNQHVSIIRSDGSFEPAFVSFYISTPDCQKFILGSQAGATRQALTKTMIEDFQIPFPSLADQRRLAAQLSGQMASAERLRQTLTHQLDAINKLPAALLREAFSGKL
jgi:type I restriction enzyme S subunit